VDTTYSYACVATFVVGALIGFLFGRTRALLLATTERASLETKIAVLEEQLLHSESNRAEQVESLFRVREELQRAFAEVSARALKSNNESFLQLAEQVLGQRLEVAKGELDVKREAFDLVGGQIRDILGKVDLKIEQAERERSRGHGDLTRFMSTLKESSERLGAETARLSSALKSTKVQGRWGEAQLRNVVESAGLSAHCDFCEQAVGKDGSRPDLIIALPHQRKLVVDAKVSLNACLEAAGAVDEVTRQQKLTEHVVALKQHIRTLADRDYPRSIAGALEFTMLFLPSESLYASALECEQGIPAYAFERRVLIVTPVSLVSFLTLVSSSWQTLHLEESAKEISVLGRELYDRLEIFCGHFVKLGRSLNSTVKDFNVAVGSLEARVLPSVRRFEELGVASVHKDVGVVDRISVAVRGAECDDSGVSVRIS
jgi:DNA recombination protein RmuC